MRRRATRRAPPSASRSAAPGPRRGRARHQRCSQAAVGRLGGRVPARLDDRRAGPHRAHGTSAYRSPPPRRRSAPGAEFRRLRRLLALGLVLVVSAVTLGSALRDGGGESTDPADRGPRVRLPPGRERPAAQGGVRAARRRDPRRAGRAVAHHDDPVPPRGGRADAGADAARAAPRRRHHRPSRGAHQRRQRGRAGVPPARLAGLGRRGRPGRHPRLRAGRRHGRRAHAERHRRPGLGRPDRDPARRATRRSSSPSRTSSATAR